MVNKFPTNDKLKLAIAFRIEGDDICENLLLGDLSQDTKSNIAEHALSLMHYEYPRAYRNARKRTPKEDLFIVTTDNTVIRYRVNPHKFGSAKIMQKYKLPENSKYLYIGAIMCNGAHFAIGDNATNVFNHLQRLSTSQIEIVKISSKYCLPATKPYNVLDKDVNEYLVECSKSQESFYDEYMRFMPYESSVVEPDGIVSSSVCPVADYPAKNAHMVNDPFWYSKMLQCKLPHLWDHTNYVYYEDGPDLKNPFGTIEEL